VSASVNIELFYLSEFWSEIDFGRHFFSFLSPKTQGTHLTQSPGHVGPSPYTSISNSTSFLFNVKWHGHFSGRDFKPERERMMANLSKRLKTNVEGNFLSIPPASIVIPVDNWLGPRFWRPVNIRRYFANRDLKKKNLPPIKPG
jgi:hypothetical protein